MKDERLFLVWHSPQMYETKEQIRQTLFSFFTHSNGFSNEEIENVDALALNQAYQTEAGGIVITRVR